MKSHIKIILKKIFPAQTRAKIKNSKRHIKTFLKGNKKTTLKELEEVLRYKIGVKKGDKIFVTSSFGYLNASYSPKETVQLLMDIVTDEGMIMMPYYPPMSSDEWAMSGQAFDMINTKSGMGVITNVFSKMRGVLKSTHPTKAVCVWGKDAEELIEGHENSTTPYYWDSPYGKILKNGCYTLGLGVTNNPIFHSIEDVTSNHILKYYLPEKKILKVITKSGKKVDVETLIHNSKILSQCVSSYKFIKTLNCNSIKKVDLGISFIYLIDNKEVLDKVKVLISKGKKNLRQKSN